MAFSSHINIVQQSFNVALSWRFYVSVLGDFILKVASHLAADYPCVQSVKKLFDI